MSQSRKQRLHTARVQKKSSKRALKTESRRRFSRETPRNQRKQTNLSVPMFFVDAMHSLGFNAIQRGRAA